MPFGGFLPGARSSTAGKKLKRSKKKYYKSPEELRRARLENQYRVLEKLKEQGADSITIRTMEIGFAKLNAYYDDRRKDERK